MVHLVMMVGAILSSSSESDQYCVDCTQELAAMVSAEQFYNLMQVAEQEAAEAYFSNPTAENLGAWMEAIAASAAALQNLYDAQAAYDDCINGPGPDEILSTTISILE